MEDQKLIEQISLLKTIEPNQNLAFSVKARILSAPVASPMGGLVSVMRYLENPAFAFAGLLLMVGGGLMVQLSGASLPGDPLYSVKAAKEQVELALVPADERLLVELDLAQRRLDEVKQVTEQNKTKNLAAAIKGYQARVSQVSLALPELAGQKPGTALLAGKTILQLKKDKLELEKVLGATFGEEESADLTKATKLVVESELRDLKTRTLTEAQAELVEQAEQAYEAGKYDASLEYLLKVGPVESTFGGNDGN